MCVFFISLPLYAQPSELFLKGQPLDIQSVVEFMESSEWFSTMYIRILRFEEAFYQIKHNTYLLIFQPYNNYIKELTASISMKSL